MNGRRSPKYAELVKVVASIKALGYDVSISGANGGVRLETEDDSQDISPRLSVPELLDWCYAYRKGILAERAYGFTPPDRSILVREVRDLLQWFDYAKDINDLARIHSCGLDSLRAAFAAETEGK
jgi:hypothetical protein